MEECSISTCPLSDHSLVSITIHPNYFDPYSCQWSMNPYLMSSPVFIEYITKQWNVFMATNKTIFTVGNCQSLSQQQYYFIYHSAEKDVNESTTRFREHNTKTGSTVQNHQVLLSKLLAMRLEDILPLLINPNQKGFIQNRFSFTNIRRLLNIIQYLNQTNYKLILHLQLPKRHLIELSGHTYLPLQEDLAQLRVLLHGLKLSTNFQKPVL